MYEDIQLLEEISKDNFICFAKYRVPHLKKNANCKHFFIWIRGAMIFSQCSLKYSQEIFGGGI